MGEMRSSHSAWTWFPVSRIDQKGVSCPPVSLFFVHPSCDQSCHHGPLRPSLHLPARGDGARERSFSVRLASVLLGRSRRWTWTALKSSLADGFHDQPSQLAVWFIPERHMKREWERERSPFCSSVVGVQCERTAALTIQLHNPFQPEAKPFFFFEPETMQMRETNAWWWWWDDEFCFLKYRHLFCLFFYYYYYYLALEEPCGSRNFRLLSPGFEKPLKKTYLTILQTDRWGFFVPWNSRNTFRAFNCLDLN